MIRNTVAFLSITFLVVLFFSICCLKMHLNVIKCIMYDKLSFECPKSIKLKVFSRIDVNNCLSTSKNEWQFLRRYKSQVFARFCRSRFKQQLMCGIGQKRQYTKFNISIIEDG